MFMAVRVICFYQPGCMGCMEQTPINTEVAKSLNLLIEEIDAIKNPQYIKEFLLKVTPTIVILKEGTLHGAVRRGCPRRTTHGSNKKISITGNRRSA